MKIVLFGVGSFVFGPSALHDAILQHRIPNLTLALVDPNPEMLQLMAGVARRMARDASLPIELTTHTEAASALPGADFVLCAAAAQLQKRFLMDAEIIHKNYPAHLITEFGGISGISYTFRQVALIRSLTRSMLQHCPNAWLLCSSNPLARVCEAAQLSGIRTAGFCSNSMGFYGQIGRILLNQPERFPWPNAVNRYEAIAAGVNHLTFLLDLRDRSTSTSIYPEFVAQAHKQNAFACTRTGQLFHETGYPPANGDDHFRDFLVPNELSRPLEMSSHGNADERADRIRKLQGVGEGREPVEVLLEHRAWERPIDFAVAMTSRTSARFHSLNIPNSGQIPNLPRNAFVETPVTIQNGEIRPDSITLPVGVEKYNAPAARLNQCVVQAALTRAEDLLARSVELDPTILDKKNGLATLRLCLAASADLIGTSPL